MVIELEDPINIATTPVATVSKRLMDTCKRSIKINTLEEMTPVKNCDKKISV